MYTQTDNRPAAESAQPTACRPPAHAACLTLGAELGNVAVSAQHVDVRRAAGSNPAVPGGEGLRTMRGWETARAMLAQAGFENVDRHSFEHDRMNVRFVSRKENRHDS